MRLGVRGHEASIGGDDLDRFEGVDREAVSADQPADATAEGQPGDADRAGVAERRRQPVGRGGDGVFARGEPRLRPCQAAVRIDVEALHRPEVEDDAAVVGAVAGEAVAATPDRQGQAGLASEDDGPRHVRGVRGADDERGVAVRVGAVDLPGGVVLRAAGHDDRSGQAGLEDVEVEVEVVAEIGDVGEWVAEGFHRLAPWCGMSSGDRGVPRWSPGVCARDSGRPSGRRHGHPSSRDAGTSRRGYRRGGPGSRGPESEEPCRASSGTRRSRR